MLELLIIVAVSAACGAYLEAKYGGATAAKVSAVEARLAALEASIKAKL